MNPLTSLRSVSPALNALGLDRAALAPGGRANPLGDDTGVRTGTAGAPQPTEGSFSNVLSRLVTEVSAKQEAAAEAVGGLQSGQPVTVHQAMIAMEEASVSFQLMAEVRNRLLESYQELMRMQV